MEKRNLIQLDHLSEDVKKIKTIYKSTPESNLEKEVNEIEKRIARGLSIKIICDFCDGPIFGKPRVLKFANMERFFCCTSCNSGYSQKYQGRIESIKRKYDGGSELEV